MALLCVCVWGGGVVGGGSGGYKNNVISNFTHSEMDIMYIRLIRTRAKLYAPNREDFSIFSENLPHVGIETNGIQ